MTDHQIQKGSQQSKSRFLKYGEKVMTRNGENMMARKRREKLKCGRNKLGVGSLVYLDVKLKMQRYLRYVRWNFFVKTSIIDFDRVLNTLLGYFYWKGKIKKPVSFFIYFFKASTTSQQKKEKKYWSTVKIPRLFILEYFLILTKDMT